MTSAWNRCNRWYQIRHVMGKRPEGDAVALDFGRLMHEGLKVWYSTNSTDAALEAIFAYPYNEPIDDYRTKGRALTTLARYIDFYRPEHFDEILLTETSFDVSDLAGFRWGGRIDLVVLWNKEVWVMDHKTTSIGGATWWDEFNLSPQMAGYVWAAKQLRGGERVAGVIINRLKVQTKQAAPEEEFQRRAIYYPDHLIMEWRDTKIQEYRAIHEARTRDAFPPRWDSCSGKYGMCPAHDVCKALPDSRHRILNSRFVDDPWDWTKEG